MGYSMRLWIEDQAVLKIIIKTVDNQIASVHLQSVLNKWKAKLKPLLYSILLKKMMSLGSITDIITEHHTCSVNSGGTWPPSWTLQQWYICTRTHVASVADITFILSIGLQRAGLRMALCSLNLKDVVEVCWGHVWGYVCRHTWGEEEDLRYH